MTPGLLPPAEVSVLGAALAVPHANPSFGRYSVCRICRGPAAIRCSLCWSCQVVVGQLGGFEVRVAPVFIFAPGSGAHDVLVGYKAAPTDPGRRDRSARLASLLTCHLARHLACSCAPGAAMGAPRRPAVLVPVPSSVGGRPSWAGRHPLVDVCTRAAAPLGEVEVMDVLRPGRVPPGRLRAEPHGYEVHDRAAVAGRRVLVVDDIFTSGARIMSAACALAQAGAKVRAAMPIGRLIRPQHSRATAAYFADALVAPWSPSRCVLCAHEPPGRPVAMAEGSRRLVARLVLAA